MDTLPTESPSPTGQARGAREQLARLTSALAEQLTQLASEPAARDVPPLADREWYTVLTRKLLPQLGDAAALVVAVVGGTNLGKSAIFNHLAGTRASASSPLASGTKHPVGLVPARLAEANELVAMFPGFTLAPWQTAEQPLEADAKAVLFWRVSPALPDNLVILDTPDIDSDAPVNWERAAAIRQVADVLLAVLTQQKYNDAAVKQFFRRAAEEDKAVVVVFNRCELPEDEKYWPLWLETFTSETGLAPEAVYVVPNDRRAAEALTLPFYERSVPRSPTAGGDVTAGQAASTAESASVERATAEGSESNSAFANESPTKLQDVFARFRFDEIKLRTLDGALRLVVHDERGVPSYLKEVAARGSEYSRAVELLGAEEWARINDWPPLPMSLLTAPIHEWWHAQRSGWTRWIHGTYGWLSGQVTQRVASAVGKSSETALAEYRQREWEAMLRAMEKLYQHLTAIHQRGNTVLGSRIERVLAGQSRAELVDQLRRRVADVPLTAQIQTLVVEQIEQARTENPRFYAGLQYLDTVAAFARPAMSVGLAWTFGVGEVVTQVASHVAVQSAFHAATEVGSGAAVAVAGEGLFSAVGVSVSQVHVWLTSLQTRFAEARARWLAEALEQLLLEGLAGDLKVAATVTQSAAYQAVERTLAELRAGLAAR